MFKTTRNRYYGFVWYVFNRLFGAFDPLHAHVAQKQENYNTIMVEPRIVLWQNVALYNKSKQVNGGRFARFSKVRSARGHRIDNQN